MFFFTVGNIFKTGPATFFSFDLSRVYRQNLSRDLAGDKHDVDHSGNGYLISAKGSAIFIFFSVGA